MSHSVPCSQSCIHGDVGLFIMLQNILRCMDVSLLSCDEPMFEYLNKLLTNPIPSSPGTNVPSGLTSSDQLLAQLVG